MEQIVFQGRIDGLEIEQVIRDYEYSMASRHFHDTYELYYLIEGQRYYFIDRQTYLVKAGEVALIKPNQIHKTSMAGQSFHNRILLQIDGVRMGPFLEACGIGSMETIYTEEAAVLSVPEEEQRHVESLLFQMQKELQEKQRQYAVGVKLKLAELLLTLVRCQRRLPFPKDSQTAQTWKHQKVHEVAEYLLNHPETEESLEEVAKRFYVSKSYLSRIFREVTGFAVNEYKNINRIKKSQQLLQHSTYSVTEISDILGFKNLTYYERVFKKYIGITPLKYRNSQV